MTSETSTTIEETWTLLKKLMEHGPGLTKERRDQYLLKLFLLISKPPSR